MKNRTRSIKTVKQLDRTALEEGASGIYDVKGITNSKQVQISGTESMRGDVS